MWGIEGRAGRVEETATAKDRTGALLVHSRICTEASMAGREGAVAQLRSKRPILSADQPLWSTHPAPCPVLQGQLLRTDHSPPREL